jgi:hypothetical protein
MLPDFWHTNVSSSIYVQLIITVHFMLTTKIHPKEVLSLIAAWYLNKPTQHT